MKAAKSPSYVISKLVLRPRAARRHRAPEPNREAGRAASASRPRRRPHVFLDTVDGAEHKKSGGGANFKITISGIMKDPMWHVARQSGPKTFSFRIKRTYGPPTGSPAALRLRRGRASIEAEQTRASALIARRTGHMWARLAPVAVFRRRPVETLGRDFFLSESTSCGRCRPRQEARMLRRPSTASRRAPRAAGSQQKRKNHFCALAH